MSDAWYPAADGYWFPRTEADEYPLRYGDVVATPDLGECRTHKGQLWSHVLVLHPSREVGAKAGSDTEVIVARINKVTDIGAQQRAASRVRRTRR